MNYVKFTGEILREAEKAVYKINMKRILKKKETTVGLADGSLLVDNKKIYEA